MDPLVGLAVIGAIRRPWLGLWALLLVFMPATSDRYLAVAVALLVAVAVRDIPPRVSAGVLAVSTALAFVVVVGTHPAITPELVEKMKAAVAAAPDQHEFAVRSNDPSVVEWFPALTGARSVGTSQGLEWVSRDAFWDAVRANEAIQHGTYERAPVIDLTSARN